MKPVTTLEINDAGAVLDELLAGLLDKHLPAAARKVVEGQLADLELDKLPASAGAVLKRLPCEIEDALSTEVRELLHKKIANSPSAHEQMAILLAEHLADARAEARR